MKVTIAGAGGYLGRNLTAALKASGADIYPLSSQPGGGIDPATGLPPEDFELEEGTEAVVYLSQSPWYRQVPEMAHHLITVNEAAAVKMAMAAVKAGARRFIYTSSANVYTPSFNPHGESSPRRRDNWLSLSKVHAEEALSLFSEDIELTILRPFGIYGPDQEGKLAPNLLSRLMAGDTFELEQNPLDEADKGGMRVSLCHIDDAVRLLAELVEKGGPPALNLAGDRGASIREIVGIMAGALGVEPVFELGDRMRQFDLLADITLLKERFSPSFIPLEEGLSAMVEHFRKKAG